MMQIKVPEVWHPIPNWPNYKVSNFGRVKSLGGLLVHFNFDGTVLSSRRKSDKILRATPHPVTGYPEIVLYQHADGKQKSQKFSVHTLVCKVFVGPKPSKVHTVDHKDGVRHNNMWTNLRWATHGQQRDTARDLGTLPVGQDHYNSKITDEQAAYVRANYIPRDPQFGASAMARDMGVTRQCLGLIIRGINRKDC